MTTARERYEAKTKVVTFRVPLQLYQEIQNIKAESGLSFSDLIKLGAGKAKAKIEAKIAQSNNLEAKLVELNEAVEAGKKRLAEGALKEKAEQLAALSREIGVFRLFDSGWTIEEVSLKLGISKNDSYERFKEWGQLREERQAVQDELVKRCLRNHIGRLQEQILWPSPQSVWRQDSQDGAKRQLAYYRQMLIHPAKLTEEDRAFLVAEYS